jgi:RimJ/RimL family protein N-acetyltransferase
MSRALTLEPQIAAHAEEMFRVLSDPAIYEYENEPPPSLEWLRERYARLESRSSPDGAQRWLNWVVRLETGELAGYVQATVHADGRAAIAYVLGSRHWGRGIASQAVSMMMEQLRDDHGVQVFHAVLKRANWRSMRLLERFGFTRAPEGDGVEIEPDESLMVLLPTTTPASR